MQSANGMKIVPHCCGGIASNLTTLTEFKHSPLDLDWLIHIRNEPQYLERPIAFQCCGGSIHVVGKSRHGRGVLHQQRHLFSVAVLRSVDGCCLPARKKRLNKNPRGRSEQFFNSLEKIAWICGYAETLHFHARSDTCLRVAEYLYARVLAGASDGGKLVLC